jgi:hypothetical protein
MDLKRLAETDANMNDGVWFRLEPDIVEHGSGKVMEEGARIKLRSSLSKEYQAALEQSEKVMRRRHGYREDKELSSDQRLEVIRTAVAKGGIVAWANFVNDDKSEEFSVEAAQRWLALPTFLRRVSNMMGAEEAFERENLEILSGN